MAMVSTRARVVTMAGSAAESAWGEVPRADLPT